MPEIVIRFNDPPSLEDQRRLIAAMVELEDSCCRPGYGDIHCEAQIGDEVLAGSGDSEMNGIPSFLQVSLWRYRAPGDDNSSYECDAYLNFLDNGTALAHEKEQVSWMAAIHLIVSHLYRLGDPDFDSARLGRVLEVIEGR